MKIRGSKHGALLLFVVLPLIGAVLFLDARWSRQQKSELKELGRLLNEDSQLWRTNNPKWIETLGSRSASLGSPQKTSINEFGETVEYVHSFLGFQWIKTVEFQRRIDDQSIWKLYAGGTIGRTNWVWYEWNRQVAQGTNGP